MNAKITHSNLKILDPLTIREALLQLKKSSDDFVLISIYIQTPTHVRFQVYSSNLTRLTHKQIKILVPRIHEKFQITLRSYQIQLPIPSLVFELIGIPKKHHVTQRKNHDLRHRDLHY
uniref:Uncharacterized protein n=1 Tax=Craspedacusta sowerbii TaxID=128124 RepID=A0A0S4M1K6_CRASO|nr:hypothetical protein [Craspedacusta sowerbii]QZN08019.1 hypothetical protein [Craspedacusta sowerbii]CUS58524.1 TPA: hypothetical protein [Craspedacusta sowerbii]